MKTSLMSMFLAAMTAVATAEPQATGPVEFSNYGDFSIDLATAEETALPTGQLYSYFSVTDLNGLVSVYATMTDRNAALSPGLAASDLTTGLSDSLAIATAVASCATECVVAAIADSNCGVLNAECYCANVEFLKAMVSCVSSDCGTGNVVAMTNMFSSYCSASSIDLSAFNSVFSSMSAAASTSAAVATFTSYYLDRYGSIIAFTLTALFVAINYI
ncbi:hypothetical protein CANCADRAFT_140647 [Tortispora caseinolytica NRRL Y-17796]|uniref:CFEM domain-containing protein n=1 Tax=Tortispora caseinolytica NRRL Y-17796 TaxID=767744 RepID=A0A1E4TCR8_9ASCO|nr:hypothetical protein CANCADRAFT_140647 [Tortispora caseinolytica NRRL Y-17796]